MENNFLQYVQEIDIYLVGIIVTSYAYIETKYEMKNILKNFNQKFCQ